MVKERKNGVLRYFGVDDIRDIRTSPRFVKEVLPLFEGDVLYTVENEARDLNVIGKFKETDMGPDREGRDRRSALLLACDTDRPYFGRFVRHQGVY